MTNRQRAELEITEFTYAFPYAELDSIPLHVWEDVKSGTKLKDAYEKYADEKRRSADKANIVNMKNADMSSGRISGTPKKAVYTASEVSSMSAADVKNNYDDILASMKSAGFYS